MNIFLGAETEGLAASKWFELQKVYTKKLLCINDINYGKGLDSIAIISIIMREEFFEHGGYKEKVYYNKRRAEADIRLRIDYRQFVFANTKKREKIYIEHILESIRIAGIKAGTEFDLNKLLRDVSQLLSNSEDNRRNNGTVYVNPNESST